MRATTTRVSAVLLGLLLAGVTFGPSRVSAEESEGASGQETAEARGTQGESAPSAAADEALGDDAASKADEEAVDAAPRSSERRRLGRGLGLTRDPRTGLPSKAVPTQEIKLPSEVRAAVLGNELHGRLSSVVRASRFMGSAPGGGRWQRDAIGQADAVPMLTNFERDVLRTMTLRDGSRVWLAGGSLHEPAAILRLGDLLPLLSAIGINDRETALAVSQIAFGGGSHPPAYTMTVRTGTLWPHRRTLAASAKNGRIVYSLVTGRVTVLGGLVVADAEGELRVRFVEPEGDDVGIYTARTMSSVCRSLEEAIRGDEPESALDEAYERLEVPSVAQACAARFLAIVAPDGVAERLRTVMTTGQVGQPGELVEALVHLEPEPTEVNVQALTTMIERGGSMAARGVCRHAPIWWIDQIIERDGLSEPNRISLTRCANE